MKRVKHIVGKNLLNNVTKLKFLSLHLTNKDQVGLHNHWGYLNECKFDKAI